MDLHLCYHYDYLCWEVPDGSCLWFLLICQCSVVHFNSGPRLHCGPFLGLSLWRVLLEHAQGHQQVLVPLHDNDDDDNDRSSISKF